MRSMVLDCHVTIKWPLEVGVEVLVSSKFEEVRKGRIVMSTSEDWLYSDDLDVGVLEVSDFGPSSFKSSWCFGTP